ncbi:hypothetical protein GQR58_021154 [Nymphon striatum]|nr:hypothetical protein GQR58_021154 [Nymphon striatum]
MSLRERTFSTGNYEVQAIQPTATDHGRIAALNMTGHLVKHNGSVNMNVLDTLGLISHSFGLWMGVEGGDTMEKTKIKMYLELFASLMHLLPPGTSRHKREIKITQGTSVQDVIDEYNIPLELAHIVLVNGVFVC